MWEDLTSKSPICNLLDQYQFWAAALKSKNIRILLEIKVILEMFKRKYHRYKNMKAKGEYVSTLFSESSFLKQRTIVEVIKK
jgi:hypothetical protein